MSYNSKYKSSEIEAILDSVEGKQDEITDLATIRSGAAKGATALQSEQYKGTITGVSANGTSVATSGVANIPAASTSKYGVTKLSSATNSTSTSLAATASAVKAAYDLANSYKGTVTSVKINGTTKSPSSGVVDLGTVITSHQDISGKQDKLVSGTNIKTINGTSLLGSGNIVISGGGGSSSGNGAYAEVNHGTSDTTFTLTPNTFHVWEEVSALTLTLGSETAGVANEFLFQFTSGATATTLTLPDDIKWANDSAPTIAENKIYQVSILKGMASVLEFDNVVEKRENYIYGIRDSYLISAQYPVASDVTIEYWDNLGDDIYTVVMIAGTSEVTISERFGYIENVSPKEDDQFFYVL